MKSNLKVEDLVPPRDLKEAISRLPLEFRLAGSKPEELVKALRKEDLKRLKELLTNIDLD